MQQPWKRTFDLLLTIPALALVWPLLLVIAVIVRRTMGKPVLFRQVRAGQHGLPITLLKFRTMSDTRGPDGKLLPDAERLTDFGRWLRATSLDELPQLWTVLRGGLSLVGPRPLLMEYLPHYTPEQARRHEVVPGMTNLPAVNGRNALDWERKFALDTWYVEHWSLGLDICILWATVGKVLSREGAAETMPKFVGCRPNPKGELT